MSLTQWEFRILVRIFLDQNSIFSSHLLSYLCFFFVQFQWLMNMFQCVIVIVEVISKCLTALRKHYSATLRPPRVFSPSNDIRHIVEHPHNNAANPWRNSIAISVRVLFFGRNYFCCCCCPRFTPPLYGCLSGSGVNKFVMKLIN